MEELGRLLDQILDEKLVRITLSGRRGEEGFLRVRIRPVWNRNSLHFQAAQWDGKKEFHLNLEREEMKQRILLWMEESFRQLQAEHREMNASALVSKKGKVTVSRKRVPVQEESRTKIDPRSLGHNRTKKYLLPASEPVPFLVKLGVMTPQGQVVASRYDKFRQINRFLEFIEDIRPQLPSDREISMIDFGCGKSYLTFAVYYYLHEVCGLDVRITGLDLKEDVIRRCNELARQFGYEKLRFMTGDIAQYEGAEAVDLVMTLHACDTATDYALEKAVSWNAIVILSVPCCQHELNRQIRCDVLEPVLKYGILKERIAALVTDGLRASLLEEAGYEVQVLEFIDMEHTPKNLLLRAVRKSGKAAAGMEPSGRLSAAMDALHVSPTLARLLGPDAEERLI